VIEVVAGVLHVRQFSCLHISNQHVIVCTRVLKALRTLAFRHQAQKHEIILFDVTTVILSCEAGERWVQNSLPGTK
jgi:hypothetical protein